MRFAAIADIHGNIDALEAVLADISAQGIADTDVVNLGDHASGPLEAARTTDLLMARGFTTIRGDQDRILVELARAGTSRRMDLRQLEPRHIDWLGGQPAMLLWRDNVLLCHGSPRDDAAYWLDRVGGDGSVVASRREQIEADATGITASLILCAHTHLPRVVRLGDGRFVVNPGSVGLPGYDGQKPVYHKVQTGTPDASYAILELKARGWSVTFRQVSYDNLGMAEMARRNGLVLWANAIATGWVD